MIELDDSATRTLLAVPMHTRPLVYAAMTGDAPDGCPVQCAACGAVRPLRESLIGRVAIDYAGPGIDPVACQHASADAGQHFACNPACLRAALMTCHDEHLAPAHALATDKAASV